MSRRTQSIGCDGLVSSWGKTFLRAGIGGGLLFAPLFLHGQQAEYALPDAVVSFTSGEGGGRGNEYMPGNVLGLPDTVGRESIATTNPKQILSLGLEGEIILRFDQVRIVDGPGVDFTVFENAFIYRLGGKDKLYAEPAEVAVSSDGVEYTPFPYDSQTLQGCAGVTPTYGDQPPYDPVVSGGDGFDLAEVGMSSVRFIRIRDVTRMVKENTEHPFYDVTLNGFDLDAVVAVNVESAAVSGLRDLASVEGVELSVPSVITSSSLSFDLLLPRSGAVCARLIDLTGEEKRRIETVLNEGGERLVMETEGLPSGTYLLTIGAEGFGNTTRTVRILR